MSIEIYHCTLFLLTWQWVLKIIIWITSCQNGGGVEETGQYTQRLGIWRGRTWMQSYNQCAAHLGQVPPLLGLLFIIWNMQQLDHSPLRSLSTLNLWFKKHCLLKLQSWARISSKGWVCNYILSILTEFHIQWNSFLCYFCIPAYFEWKNPCIHFLKTWMRK